MSFTTDDTKLFQSDAQHDKQKIRQAKAEALKDVGDPIQLATKPLRVVVRNEEAASAGHEPEAWVAESGFIVRRVGLDSGKTKQIYKGHAGPVTSLGFYTTKTSKRALLISGSWDKSFRVWDIETKALVSSTVGHVDFVKALCVVPELDILVTGSSDKDVRVWDLSVLDSFDFASLSPPHASTSTAEPKRAPARDPTAKPAGPPPAAVSQNPLPVLLRLKSHTRPIEQLAYFHVLSSDASSDVSNGSTGPTSTRNEDDTPRTRTGQIGLVSADSMGVVKLWQLEKRDDVTWSGVEKSSSRLHELAVYDLALGSEGEMWTASADNSVLLSSLSFSSPSTPPTPLVRIPHPSQTRAVLSLPLALPNLAQPGSYLLTTCSDELIRIFNLDDEALEPDAKRELARDWRGIEVHPGRQGGMLDGCVQEVEGHVHEIVQLVPYLVKPTTTKPDESGRAQGSTELWILSASLDGTLRRWRWQDLLRTKRDRLVVVAVDEDEQGQGKVAEGLLTEEEERELAELMGDDDE
ncbi:hypothetical protein JCM10212_002519 [Sporobolomyces blumeae]